MLQRVFRYLRSYLPQALPQSESAMIKFASEICYLAALPCNDSFQHAIFTQVMHLDASAKYVSKQQFISALRRSICNQAAYNLICILKEQNEKKKKEAQAEAELKAFTNATSN